VPPIAACSRSVSLGERLEDGCLLLVRNADASVADSKVQAGSAAFSRLNCHHHPHFASLRKLDGVAYGLPKPAVNGSGHRLRPPALLIEHSRSVTDPSPGHEKPEPSPQVPNSAAHLNSIDSRSSLPASIFEKSKMSSIVNHVKQGIGRHFDRWLAWSIGSSRICFQDVTLSQRARLTSLKTEAVPHSGTSGTLLQGFTGGESEASREGMAGRRLVPVCGDTHYLPRPQITREGWGLRN
jgi:hypothetical protein